MEELKDVDYKILAALLKNSKTSDRQLSKEIGVSQPTVTRRRARLEKEVIDGYTFVPKWTRMGYKILAFTFIKSRENLWTKEHYEAVRARGTKWAMQHPNVLMSGGCRGMGLNGFVISVHKDYSDFDQFTRAQQQELGDMLVTLETIIVNLQGLDILKPLHLKYLAEAE